MPIDGKTRLAFLLGHPVTGSLSPAMHQAAFAVTGLNAAYLPWPVAPAGLPDAVRGLRTLENFLGANVTIPHKEPIVPLLDGLTPEAETVGAVNTVVPTGGRLIGDNTDVEGFLWALRNQLACDPAGQVVAVLGAGGAARAVAVGLARARARRLLLLNRSPERAVHLATELAGRFPDCQVEGGGLRPRWRPDGVADLVLLVNTAGGDSRDEGDPWLDPAGLAPPLHVYDCRYGVHPSALLTAAKTRGCAIADGLGMLLEQGALAFERWTGQPAPRAAMREALLSGEGGYFP